ncbi:MAG: hypothetical protein F6K04_05360 [Leptolyngbya sp. SIO4C5]|nr:hypothetical protein [Leptolyngbya sp. SIO4C5]
MMGIFGWARFALPILRRYAADWVVKGGADFCGGEVRRFLRVFAVDQAQRRMGKGPSPCPSRYIAKFTMGTLCFAHPTPLYPRLTAIARSPIFIH